MTGWRRGSLRHVKSRFGASDRTLDERLTDSPDVDATAERDQDRAHEPDRHRRAISRPRAAAVRACSGPCRMMRPEFWDNESVLGQFGDNFPQGK
jgi:hypothetical protein